MAEGSRPPAGGGGRHGGSGRSGGGARSGGGRPGGHGRPGDSGRPRDGGRPGDGGRPRDGGRPGDGGRPRDGGRSGGGPRGGGRPDDGGASRRRDGTGGAAGGRRDQDRRAGATDGRDGRRERDARPGESTRRTPPRTPQRRTDDERRAPGRGQSGRDQSGRDQSRRDQTPPDRARRDQPGRGETPPRGQTGSPRGAGSGRSDRGPRPGRPRDGGGAGAPRASRPRSTDLARRAAFDVLRAVDASGSYANLVLPPLLAERGIRGRDAAFATELAYGTLRLRGRYDAIVALTSHRPLEELDAQILDVLRLGLHQLLGMRVPPHAAVAETVALARSTCGAGPAQLVNAVLRAAAERDLNGWLERLRTGPEPLATEHSHPAWMVRALREALVGHGRPVSELAALLAADNLAPEVTLVARPGLGDVAALRAEAERARLEVGGEGRWTPTALRLAAGDPAALPSVRSGVAGVQDEGSQLVTLAAAAAAGALGDPPRPVVGPWLDMCAGPGGKAALLGAVLAQAGGGRARLVASELAPHRADLVRRSVRALAAATDDGGVEVRTGDGRDLGRDEPARYALTLLDAPCSGLGALRRRPESRWRRTPADVGQLGALQRDLLTSALAATAPGGVVAYVTCSPHLAETHAVVDDAVRSARVEVLDAVAAVQAVATRPVPDLGSGPYVQLWPHLHGTDAMFLALLRVPARP